MMLLIGPGSVPVLDLAKQLVGGVWHGTVGKDTKIEFRFTMENDGTMLVGKGVVGLGSKKPMKVRSSLGWDPVTKQVYYLDQHGSDTVYFGHVTRSGSSLTFDFRGLAGDSGHYRSHETLSRNHYSATMDVEQGGVWKPLGLHLELSR